MQNSGSIVPNPVSTPAFLYHCCEWKTSCVWLTNSFYSAILKKYNCSKQIIGEIVVSLREGKPGMELGDKTPYTGRCIRKVERGVGTDVRKSRSHYVLYLSGGGGGALCGLCKVPGTEDRPSQFHYHLPQWWASTHRSTHWELFLTMRWIRCFVCLLVSRHGCSCGGEECLTEEPECLLWSTAGNGQGKDKEGLLLHLTQGGRESYRGVVTLVTVGKLMLKCDYEQSVSHISDT